ncbi:MAG TPA: type II secretion system protein [Verrucomicrobiae bacterium]|nr:type II secretion system protein [Verrucomicrobiae bacterium]
MPATRHTEKPAGHTSRHPAFTLLELLIVIAIIGVLAALLLPVISSAKSHAQAALCQNHMRQMGQALQMYVHENANKYPFYLGPAGPSYGDAIGRDGRAVGLIYWSTKLYPYYAVNWTSSGYHCPGYTGLTTGPFSTGAADRLGSYTYNLFGAMVMDDSEIKDREHFGLGPVIFWQNAPAVSESQVSAPSEMLSIGESRFRAGTAARGGQDTMHCGLPDVTGFEFDTRHGKNFNQLFCDGHVLAMNPWTLFNPTNSAPIYNYDHQSHPELWIP